MCGICGTVGRANEAELRSMTNLMAHRGPDGSGVTVFPGSFPAGLGHRRLAILDPSPAGAQPMEFKNRWWITYNGELYNFRELRRELESSGHVFSSGCDTEVLLRMFTVWGPAMLGRLNGIFSLGIWDNAEKRLFLARDRLGVKPLYFTQQSGVFAFASELKTLLPYLRQVALEPTALADYLTFLWVPDPKTAFQGISQLAPGHYALLNEQGLTLHRYWDLQFDPEELPEPEWSERIAEAVRSAVQRQMVSDVPLGSFLSGGIDSSAVVAAMSATGERVTTYTIGYSEEDLRHEIMPGDLQYARQIGKVFNTQYHEEVLEPNVLELLPKAVWHLEEPVADPAAISTYLVCREAGTHMPVMLSGVGGDEIFAGYPRYLAYKLSRAADRIPRSLRLALQAAVQPLARPGPPGRFRGPRRNLWKFMRAANYPPFERYLSYLTYYTGNELNEVIPPDLVDPSYDPLARHRAYLLNDVEGGELNRLLYTDAKTFLPCLNLTYTDKMSMASSVEVRVPFLDDQLVELASRLPVDLKLKRWQRKYIFKRSQEGILPREIIWRSKAGFGAPLRSWLAKDLAPLMGDLLSERTLRNRGLIRPDVVPRLHAENATGHADHTLRLYALLTLELWCRTFLDRTWKFEDTASAQGPPARVVANDGAP
jgi:asparagine synthase (glutamine-hydrolysing)